MPVIDENRIVRMIGGRFGTGGPALVRGIGDDAAVLHPRGAREYWAITTDMLLEDVDFRRSWTTPSQLGYKSLAVNLSDLAAMGARPRFYLAALALPADVSERWIASFYRGMSALARQHRAALAGGDLSSSPGGIQVTITAIGETIDRKPVYRSGGRPGDALYVTGVLGKAAAGLALLQQGRIRGRNAAERSALKSHRTPQPRCEVGAWLARNGFATCMIDLSDGLSMDLPRLCAASGTGAEICGSLLPIYPDARGWQSHPEKLALHGGEDFELLFAVPARKVRSFEEAYPAAFPAATRIGALRRDRGVVWKLGPDDKARPLTAAGFDHFRKFSPGPGRTTRELCDRK